MAQSQIVSVRIDPVTVKACVIDADGDQGPWTSRREVHDWLTKQNYVPIPGVGVWFQRLTPYQKASFYAGELFNAVFHRVSLFLVSGLILNCLLGTPAHAADCAFRLSLMQTRIAGDRIVVIDECTGRVWWFVTILDPVTKKLRDVWEQLPSLPPRH